MNRQNSLRQVNYSHVLLIVGLVLAFAVVMFRPAGADGVTPTSVDVFETSDTVSGNPAEVKVGDLPKINNVDYNVLLNNRKSAQKIGLTGIPLIEVLKAGGVKIDNVQFVKVRYGTDNDSAISLIPLNQTDIERPPIILTEGRKPGLGPFKTPAIVPGQPDLNKPLSEDSFVGFKTGSKVEPIKLVPGAPGARIMSIKVRRSDRRKSDGQYTLTASITRGGGGGAMSYTWYGYDKNGKEVKLESSGKSITTTDGADGNAVRTVNVVVTERGTGSTGAGSTTYQSEKKQKGATKNPYPEPTPATGTGNGTGTGTGTGTPGGSLSGGAVNTLPTPTTSPTPTPAPTQTTPTPTDQTTAPTEATTSSTVDSTAITNAAQNVSGTGGLKTVTGVLLSAPSVAPTASGGGGTQLSALPAPVADQLNSIFQPVNDMDDAWAYLLALLFAFTFSGAVREWVKP